MSDVRHRIFIGFVSDIEIDGGANVETFNLITENNSTIVTENGDNIIIENG